MKNFLILRLTNAAIALDAKGDHNLAELITEAIKEIGNGDLREATRGIEKRKRMGGEGNGEPDAR